MIILLLGQLTLSSAVDRAIGQYPSITVARAAVSHTAADTREAGAALLPRITLDASATQNQLPGLVYPLHGLPSGAAGPFPAFERTIFQGSAFLNWTFLDFGTRRGRTRATRALQSAAEAALSGAQQQLIARTANAYLRVITVRQTLAAQDQRLTALTAESERTRRLLNEGKVARVELLRAEATVARARADRSGTAGALDGAEHELAEFTSLSFDQVTRDTMPDVNLSDTTVPDRGLLIGRARETSADIQEIRHRAEAARLTAASTRTTPEFRLQAGVVDRGAPGNPMKAEWQAGVGVSYPLYTGGAQRGATDRAEADAQAAAAQLALAEMAAAAAVDRALSSVTEAHARVLALRSAVDQSNAVAEIERTSLEVGSGTQTDYLDALAQLLGARSALIEARHAEVFAHIELARVTGELSPQWLATHLESVR